MAVKIIPLGSVLSGLPIPGPTAARPFLGQLRLRILFVRVLRDQ